MLRKMFVSIICIATAFAMMPTVSFGTTVQDEDVLMLQEASLPIQEELTVDGKFVDEGDKYTIEDVSRYNKNMKIYGFYLGSGYEGDTSQYGDALLIESNGKYLLMDAGAVSSADTLVSCLKSVMKKNSKLDIYISHVHGDHTGGLEKVMLNFDVGTVFMPDIEVCENYVTPNVGKTVDEIYIEHVAIAKTGGADKIVYLRPDSSARPSAPRATNTYSRFNVGGALCTVIGPLGTYKPDDFIEYVKELKGYCGTKEGHCINNSSLCTMVECGDTNYLATGDVEKFEEAKLVEKYGGKLDCDIMKMPHHGLRTSCTEDFASKATPMWSFQFNHGYTGKINKTAINTAKKYGYNYGIATDMHSIVFDVAGSKVRVNIDENDNEAVDDGYLKGWIATGENYQYYSNKGYIKTGAKWVDKTLYHFSTTSGFKCAGTCKINGVTVKFGEDGELDESEIPETVEMTTAKAGKNHTAILKWESAEKADGYQVYRARSENGKYYKIATRGSKAKTYTNRSLKKGKTYYYKVCAVRYLAGGTVYGDYSETKCVKAR